MTNNSYAARRARYRNWLIRKSAWGCAKLLAVAVFFGIGITTESTPIMAVAVLAVLVISLAEFLVERRLEGVGRSDAEHTS